MALIVRREYASGDEGKRVLRRYVHRGTGNYHTRTAGLYTDFGLITANEGICADVNDVFVQLTGLGKATKLAHVWQAPFTLHERVLHAIDNETRIAKAGKRGVIIAKMNSLLEPQVIEALYRASAAGVKIDLIVRVMLSSADWMERNFFRRIELCFPVLDARLKKRVIGEGLTPYLRDNAQT